MEQITPNVYVETQKRGSNPGFVVTSRGVIMIDAPVDPGDAKAWTMEIARRGKLLYLINTEHHLDHWVCNSLFDVEVISHEITRQTMLTMDIQYIRNRTKILYSDPLPLAENHQLKFPTITYTGKVSIYAGSHTLHLIHTPGHTAGETAVYIPEEKVVFCGDNVIGQLGTPFHDALPEKWIESLKVLEGLDASFFVPGHGKVCDKKYLPTQASIVRGWMDEMEKAKREKTKVDEEIIKKKIDPYAGLLDVGIKPGLKLPPTSQR
jgi:cyclase